MTLSREVVVPGMLDEYRSFAALVRSLSDEEWNVASRCEGWRVADVAAHVVGQLSDVAGLRLEGLGTPEVTKRQVDERRDRTRTELADELEAATELAGGRVAAFDDAAWEAPGPPGVTGTLGFGLEALWFDTFLHGDDMRAAVGIPSSPGSALPPSLSHISQVLTDQGWGPAELEFGDLGTFPVSGGGGRVVTGDAYTFVLASTGRGDPGALGLDEAVNIYR